MQQLFFTCSVSVYNVLGSKSTVSGIIAVPANGITVMGHGSRCVKMLIFHFFPMRKRGHRIF
jgi:phosphoribosylformylglycinamidine (FGAM) synthase-like amidotransferase family enzyme